MGTLERLVEKYNIDLMQPSPIYLPIGRFKCVPKLFAELKFTKGAEIGVLRADYSQYLFRYIPNLHLTGVDLWDAYDGFVDFKQSVLTRAHEKAKEVFDAHGGVLIQDWSVEASKQIPDASLDFVFIDCNHAYEFVVADIAAWSKKVKPGGIVYGHDFDDYTNSRRWREMHVIHAVEGWMKSYKIAPWFVITNNTNRCWLYVKE